MDWVTAVSAMSWTWFLVWGCALSIIDARTHRLPNRLVLWTSAGAVITWLALAWVSGRTWWIPLVSAIVVGAFLFVLHLVGGLGMGDVKYGFVVGGYLGVVVWSSSWWALWWGVWCAFVCALPWALAHLRERRQRIAFGPFLTVGVVVSAVAVWGIQG